MGTYILMFGGVQLGRIGRVGDVLVQAPAIQSQLALNRIPRTLILQIDKEAESS